MTSEEFNKILEQRIAKMRESLGTKRNEYAKTDNVFHNFNRASAVLQTTREEALMGMAVKHFVSILDIVDNLGDQFPPPQEVISEKIGDMINYLVILEAMLYEQNQLPF
jgi:hypothetical protein